MPLEHPQRLQQPLGHVQPPVQPLGTLRGSVTLYKPRVGHPSYRRISIGAAGLSQDPG